MATYTKEDVFEDGTKKINVYDAETDKLNSFYHLNSKNEKHGQEVEYDKDGKVSVEKIYENGKCVEATKYNTSINPIIRFLKNNTKAAHLIDKLKDAKATITIKNGQLSYVHAVQKIPNGQLKGYLGATYQMEFQNGKEHKGKFFLSGAYENYIIKDSNLYEYKNGCLDGLCHMPDQWGKYVDGKFSGWKPISLKHSHCAQFLPSENKEHPENLGCKQVFTAGQYVAEQCSWYGGRFYLPQNGEAVLEKDIVSDEHGTLRGLKETWEVKDYQKNGKYLSYSRDGQVTVSGFYKNGKKNGVWKFYDEKGNLTDSEFWQNGKNETAKLKAIKTVATNHADETKPSSKFGKAMQKGIRSFEVIKEMVKGRTE